MPIPLNQMTKSLISTLIVASSTLLQIRILPFHAMMFCSSMRKGHMFSKMIEKKIATLELVIMCAERENFQMYTGKSKV